MVNSSGEPAVSAEEIERITAEITLGVGKQQSSVFMTSELSEVWDQIARQVADIKARGRVVEISFD